MKIRSEFSSRSETDSPAHAHLRLAGVTRLSVQGRSAMDVWVFDPHRLALPCWAMALAGKPPALLITLDRHFDLVAPTAEVPLASAGLHALDDVARWNLDVRNVDHILAGMDAGLISDVLAVARATPRGAVTSDAWVDRRGTSHAICRTPSWSRVADGFGMPHASPEARWLWTALERSSGVILDLDLDCFTTPNDVDPTDLLCWPLEQIRAFLMPEDSEPLWEAVLSKTVAVTLAREPHHCGGLTASAKLFEDFAQAFFVQLLRATPP